MRIVVTFAVEQEFAPWRRMRRFARATAFGPGVYETQVGAADVRVGITGIGLEHAARVTQTLLADGAQACISAGLAGGLRPEHRNGRILVGRTVRTSVGDVFVQSDSRLRRLAAIHGARVVEAFYTSERVLLTAKEKAALSLLADAVEMESFAVLGEARRWHVPAIAVRAIGDTATVDLPVDFNRTIGRAGRLSLPRILGQVARRPHSVPGLIRLGAMSRRAASALALFLDSFLEALAEQSREHDSFSKAAAG